MILLLLAGCNSTQPDIALSTRPEPAARAASPAPVEQVSTAPAAVPETRPVQNAETPAVSAEKEEVPDQVLELIRSASSISEETGESIQDIVSALEKISQSDDRVATIIDNLIQRDENPPADMPAATDPVSEEEQIAAALAGDAPKETADKPAETIIPEDSDPVLATEALAAAFALIRPETKMDEVATIDAAALIPPPAKAEGIFRIALLAPFSGPDAGIGEGIRKGAELAFFELQLRQVDLIFKDTAGGVDQAINEAVRDQADLILGPVFAEDTRRATPQAAIASIPMLSFSNDVIVAQPGVWILGQTPEQEIETALAFALEHVQPYPKSGRRDLAIALIEQDSIYGRRVANHAATILAQAGFAAVERLTIDAATRADEKALRQLVRRFARWSSASASSTARIPVFDLVIIAGDNAFSLGVAPVLAWYDLDPEKVQYLGTSLLNDASTLQEPSLAGAWYASAPMDRNEKFTRLWAKTSAAPAPRHAMLGFDAVALIGAIVRDRQAELNSELTNPTGFSGFSGMFRLMPDGRNIRLLDVRQIGAGASKVIAPSPKSF